MQIFPALPGLTYPVDRTAEWDTAIQEAKNKYQVRLPQMSNPLWHWDLTYEFLRDWPYGGFFTVTELHTLEDFFLYHQGAAGDFLFLDPDDHYVGPAMVDSAPNVPLAQLVVVSDGAGNYFSPLQRTRGGLFYEDITDLDTSGTGSTMGIYANGVLQAPITDYVIEGPGLAVPGAGYAGLYLAWTSQPEEPVTAEFSFYFRAHFEGDELDFQKFSNQFWTVGGSGSLKLEQSRIENPAFNSGGGGGEVPAFNYADADIPNPTGDPLVWTLANTPNPPLSAVGFKNNGFISQGTAPTNDYYLDGNEIHFAVDPTGDTLVFYYRY